MTVAQAAHWFDLDAFYREVDRVLKPGGVVALWCYGIMGIDAGIDRILHRFEHERVGPYWPEERRHVDAEYRTLPFPYPFIFFRGAPAIFTGIFPIPGHDTADQST